eukprot:812687-Pyramimonas_sp.AAC.1
MIDEAVKRFKIGAVQVFDVGGGHRSWQSENGTFNMDPIWDDSALSDARPVSYTHLTLPTILLV